MPVSYSLVRIFLMGCNILDEVPLRVRVSLSVPFFVILSGLLGTAVASDFSAPIVSILDGD